MDYVTEERYVELAFRAERHRNEWVDGIVLGLGPVTLAHAEIVSFLMRLVGTYLELTSQGYVHGGAYQIRWPGRRRSPDLYVVRVGRESMMEQNQCSGSPDLIVEVVSNKGQDLDRVEKYGEYAAFGVAEYWLVDEVARTVEAYRLSHNQFVPIRPVGGRIFSAVLPGFWIRPSWFAGNEFPKLHSLARRMTKQSRFH